MVVIAHKPTIHYRRGSQYRKPDLLTSSAEAKAPTIDEFETQGVYEAKPQHYVQLNCKPEPTRLNCESGPLLILNTIKPRTWTLDLRVSISKLKTLMGAVSIAVIVWLNDSKWWACPCDNLIIQTESKPFIMPHVANRGGFYFSWKH